MLDNEDIQSIIRMDDDENLYSREDIKYAFTQSDLAYPKSIKWLVKNYINCDKKLNALELKEAPDYKTTLDEHQIQGYFRLANLQMTRAQLESQIRAMLAYTKIGSNDIKYHLSTGETLVITERGTKFNITKQS